MRLTHAILVIVDISGYTRFISHPTVSLLHAETIVSELIESVIDRACHPLTVNKLEGDAALLYRELEGLSATYAVSDVMAQVSGFFSAFDACLETIASARTACPCDACQGARALRLKAFVHVGEIAIKSVRQFTELAGEPVIVVHRMLKNDVQGNEYVLFTDIVRMAGQLDTTALQSHRESDGSLEHLPMWVASPSQLSQLPAGRDPTRAAPRAPHDGPVRKRLFHHLPSIERGLLSRIRGLVRTLLRRVAGGVPPG